MDTTTHRPGGGLYATKAATARRLEGIVDHAVARGISADAITWAGMLLAAGAAGAVAAGAMIAPVWWLAVPPLVTLRLLAAVADGQVARRAGTGRPAGALLGEVADRGGDLLLAAGVVAIAPVPAAIAAVGMVVGDDVATIGWALTGTRTFPGVGGKPDRSALVAVGLVAAIAWPPLAPAVPWLLCALVWVGAAVRLRAVRRAVAS